MASCRLRVARLLSPPSTHPVSHRVWCGPERSDSTNSASSTTTKHITSDDHESAALLPALPRRARQCGQDHSAARAPAQRLRGNQQPRTMTHDDRRVPRSGRVSLVATRRRAGDDRAPKASNADCRGGPQRASRERMAEPPPRGADYHGCPRRRSGGTQCDTPSDTGSLACSF